VVDDTASSPMLHDGPWRHRGGKGVASPYVPTRCQNTPPAPCVTTPRRQRGWSRGTWLLPAIEHPPMPCATTSCRTSPPEGRLDGTLPATICWRRCSTASSGCDPGQRVLARVSKNRARRCLTPCRRRTYS